MGLIFQWDAKNTLHLEKHGVSPVEAEYVVNNAEHPFPQKIARGKFIVWGPTESGRQLQVIFVHKLPEDVDYYSLTLEQLVELSDRADEPIVRIIHAMPLAPKPRRRYRRVRRRKK